MVWLLVLFDKSKECSKKQKKPPGNLPEGCVSVTGGIRTPDRSLRRRMLYPAELL